MSFAAGPLLFPLCCLRRIQRFSISCSGSIVTPLFWHHHILTLASQNVLTVFRAATTANRSQDSQTPHSGPELVEGRGAVAGALRTGVGGMGGRDGEKGTSARQNASVVRFAYAESLTPSANHAASAPLVVSEHGAAWASSSQSSNNAPRGGSGHATNALLPDHSEISGSQASAKFRTCARARTH